MLCVTEDGVVTVGATADDGEEEDEVVVVVAADESVAAAAAAYEDGVAAAVVVGVDDEDAVGEVAAVAVAADEETEVAADEDEEVAADDDEEVAADDDGVADATENDGSALAFVEGAVGPVGTIGGQTSSEWKRVHLMHPTLKWRSLQPPYGSSATCAAAITSLPATAFTTFTTSAITFRVPLAV